MRTPPLHSPLSGSRKSSCACGGTAVVDTRGVGDSGESSSLSVVLKDSPVLLPLRIATADEHELCAIPERNETFRFGSMVSGESPAGY